MSEEVLWRCFRRRENRIGRRIINAPRFGVGFVEVFNLTRIFTNIPSLLWQVPCVSVEGKITLGIDHTLLRKFIRP